MKEETKKLYKILVDGKSCHGGNLAWSLPEGDKPGEWHTVEDKLKICESGLHLTTERFNWYKWGCTAYEAEAKDIASWDGDKCVAKSVRLIKEVPHPKWWTDTVSWVDTLKNISWLKPDGKPNKEWKLYPTRAAARNAARNAAWDAARNAVWDAARNAVWNAVWDAARNAARNAAWDAARNAAWDAAWDAALYARGMIVADIKLEEKHRAHIKKRMEVWQKGYGLLCDVNKDLYVYEKI
jgi:hypothetical protein